MSQLIVTVVIVPKPLRLCQLIIRARIDQPNCRVSALVASPKNMFLMNTWFGGFSMLRAIFNWLK